MQERKLRWYVHVKRRNEDYMIRWTAERRKTGKSPRRKPRKR